MKHPFFRGLRAPLHISHRGGAALMPENTLLAFEAAVRLWRTDVLEIDVHLTRDGELVVAHDDTVDRCTDQHGAISSFTFADLSKLDAGFRFTADDGKTFPFRGSGARIPRLVEVLRQFPGVRFNLELKTRAALDPFVQLLRSEHAVNRLCMGSEHDAIGIALATAVPEACHFYPRDALTEFIMPLKLGAEVIDDERFTVLDMPLWFQGMRLFDATLRDEAAKRGKWINLWTIDDPIEMKQLVAEGAGGIMTDRPDLLREVLG